MQPVKRYSQFDFTLNLDLNCNSSFDVNENGKFYRYSAALIPTSIGQIQIYIQKFADRTVETKRHGLLPAFIGSVCVTVELILSVFQIDLKRLT